MEEEKYYLMTKDIHRLVLEITEEEMNAILGALKNKEDFIYLTSKKCVIRCYFIRCILDGKTFDELKIKATIV